MKAFRCSRVVLFEDSKGYQSSLKAAETVVLLVTAHKNSEKWRGFQVEDDGIEACAAKVQRDTDTVHWSDEHNRRRMVNHNTVLLYVAVGSALAVINSRH